MGRSVAALAATLVLAVGPVLGAAGIVGAGSTATGVARGFENGWNDGKWFCRTGSPTFSVGTFEGRCSGRQATIEFAVTSGVGTTNVDHTFEYDVVCTGDSGSDQATGGSSAEPMGVIPDGGGGRGGGFRVHHTVRFDGGPMIPIDSGTFDFDLSGGDSLRLVTSEGPLALHGPAIGRFGVFAAATGLALGLFGLLRGRTACP